MEMLHTQLKAIQNRLSWVSTEPVNWKLYVQSFSWGVYLFEAYLSLRQYPNYSKTSPPPELAKHVDAKTFEKSQAYGRDKARFGFVSGFIHQVLDTLMIQYGVYAFAWDLAGRVVGRFGYGGEYEILQSNVFVGLLALFSTLTSIPLSLYSTFVLEEKHGFNKTTPKLFVVDLLKSLLLMVVLGAPFLSGFLWVFKWAGERFVPWIMTFLLIFQLSMVILYPTVIQPLFNKLSPLREGELRTRIERLAVKLKFPLKHLYEIDGSKRSSHSNAYFFGLPWSKHIVIFDTLIAESTPEEVEAVLAHELGHWYFLHPTKLLLVSQLHIFSILALFPAFLNAPPVLQSFGFGKSVAEQSPTIVAFLLFQMLLTPAEAVVGALMNALSRRFEWQADRFACEISERVGGATAGVKEGNGKDEAREEMADMGARLGRALTTLHLKNLSTIWVDWLYSAFHHSHPTLLERLRAIEAFEAKRVKKEL